ncbi:peptide chain release factor N(5)-glutamine methyltransferase [Blochmannia endosymbiont of Camponotus (Colobopsis) obliquus]|uniref:peptide chain release factor N(5)-glutamine methyltransferase n=1 Tax=Blochmannia endosymbiont of Camponotus (Colobopsis) obliquus TaxID=1505597 RepID=UPI00061A7FCD|nr:peptide chain release factor N(5)-glutamine methyltransferase [Blochmannia endosymbiont of Camponotus (Colobopsis) obliquus]AKC60512.1 Release factor glutamine methyltransferase [Blochmannia endosymbiont of Camponotus (Colobopsis) obliquus]
MTWKKWLEWAQTQLYCSTSPRLDAEIILSKILNKSRTYILAFDDTVLNEIEKYNLLKLLYRRKQGEPIAYLIGMQEFWSLNIQVYYDIFIPRSDTECLVEQVLNLFTTPNIKVLDLGTGSGAIALAIASEHPEWDITAVDCQMQAIKLACANAVHLNLNNILFLYGNWFNLLHNNYYNVIVSNPPYLDIQDSHLLCANLKFESKQSLISANQGLADLNIIIKYSPKHLLHGGWLIVEHGWKQGRCVRVLFKNSGFKKIVTLRDYNKNERATCGQWCY